MGLEAAQILPVAAEAQFEMQFSTYGTHAVQPDPRHRPQNGSACNTLEGLPRPRFFGRLRAELFRGYEFEKGEAIPAGPETVGR